MSLRRFLVLTSALALQISVAFAAPDTVWSGLVVATNGSQPQATPTELSRVEGTLKRTFGYNQFNIIGEASKTLKKGTEDWQANSKYFSLHVDSKGNTPQGYLVNLQLFKERELMLETEAKLSKSSPLVVKGPLVGDGQLLLVLVAQ